MVSRLKSYIIMGWSSQIIYYNEYIDLWVYSITSIASTYVFVTIYNPTWPQQIHNTICCICANIDGGDGPLLIHVAKISGEDGLCGGT